MDLKNLSKIDIKDLKEIDLSRAKEWLLSQPGLIINVLLIFVTVIVISSTHNNSAKATRSLKEERTQLQEKIEVLENFDAAERGYQGFMESIPQIIEADELITILSEFAIARDVRIMSFSPAKEENNRFVNVTSVEINVASEDYASIVLFMHDIESSPYFMRIGKWVGTFVASDKDNFIQETSRRSRRTTFQPSDDASTKIIQATIKIESVELQDV